MLRHLSGRLSQQGTPHVGRLCSGFHARSNPRFATRRLRQAGCARAFTDTLSGARCTAQERVGLTAALTFLRPGDTLVVWKLDRLGRSLPHLIETLTVLQERGIGFQSLTEQLDTTRSGGQLIFPVFGALAEFEHDLIRERTRAGLQAARARGRQGGRPRRVDAAKLKLLHALYADKSNSVADILRTLQISKSTLYRYVKADKHR